MVAVPEEPDIVSAVAPLVAAGVSVHWLRRRSKAPADDGWPTAETHTLDSLRASFTRGANVGIRPGANSPTDAGYLHLIDLDIRDPAQESDAWAWLLDRWPSARSAPFVVSGSGGASRHLYFFTDRPFRSRKIARSAGFAMVFDAKKERDVKKHDWEIEVFGTAKQAVLPPSIHPDTGLPYTWGREIDWSALALGIGPIVPGDTVESWGVNEDDLSLDDDDDLFALVKARPMGLSEDEITRTVADLPEEWVEDRDYWLQVGQALHHEYQGGAAGFDRWCEWSKGSDKYERKDQAVVWRSFKGAKNPVRMATLIKEAGVARLSRAHAEFEDDDFLALPGTAVALLPAPVNRADDFLALPPESAVPRKKPAPVAEVEPYDPEWRSCLQLSEEGQIKPTLHNVELIIRNDKRIRGVVGLNDFTKEIVQIANPGRFKLRKDSPKPVRQLGGALWELRDKDITDGKLWSDSHDIALRLILETPDRQGGYGLKTSDRDLVGALNRSAQSNHFHPVRDYLRSQTWDGVNRVERLFVDYVGAEDNAYHREAAMLFMIGAVTRVFEPGHKFDFVPILEGLQGARKSTFIQILGRGWSSELEGDFHDTKGMVERMQGSWIVELPELQGFSKSEVTTIKGFVSRTTDKVRLAFERRAANYPRQCVFMGSTNETEYLRDATGGRRFWPIACSVAEIDTDRLLREIDQLWAEAIAMYDAWRATNPGGALPLYMKNAAAEEARRLQDSRRQETVEEVIASRIEAWLEKPLGSELGFDELPGSEPVYRQTVCLLEIWVDMMGRDTKDYDSRAQQMMGKAVRLVPGWRYSHRATTAKYGLQRLFVRNEPHSKGSPT
jgi:hypothetical protein